MASLGYSLLVYDDQGYADACWTSAPFQVKGYVLTVFSLTRIVGPKK